MSLNELVIFAKAPRAGLVKTRLAGHLGEEGAAEAYRRLIKVLGRKLDRMERATVFYAPADGEQEVRPFFPRHWSFRAQEGDGLGERLQHAFGVSFQAGAERIVVIGTDCPYLGCGDIEQAWEALAHHDVVLGPANDGGYWLLGLKTLYSELFSGIFWGTEFVLEQTMVKAQQLGLKVALFRTLSDVDTMLDWQEFLGSADSFWSER